MTHITIMEGDKPSTKVYRVVNNQCEKGQVAQAYSHNSFTVEVNNLADLYDAIEFAREDPKRYIMRGRGLYDEQYDVRRTKLQDDNPTGQFYEMPTNWICLDFDKYIVPDCSRSSLEAIEWLVANELPAEFHNVSYIYQWSSSAGLEYKGNPIKAGTNVHLFFFLSRSVLDEEYKEWFSKEIERGFDPSTFRTVTPIFVGSHVERDADIVDIIPDCNKFGIVAKERFEVTVPKISIAKSPVVFEATSEELATEIMQKLNEIGAIHGRRSGWILLQHPKERTPGDWHLKPNNPQVVHHHVHKSKRIDRWIREFYGVDTNFKFAKSSSKADWKKTRQQLADKYREKRLENE